MEKSKPSGEGRLVMFVSYCNEKDIAPTRANMQINPLTS